MLIMMARIVKVTMMMVMMMVMTVMILEVMMVKKAYFGFTCLQSKNLQGIDLNLTFDIF